jgi:hypothetical protein
MAQQAPQATGFVPKVGTGSVVTDNIYPILFLENQQAKERIFALRNAALHRNRKNASDIAALSAAYWALKDVAEENLRKALDDGRLLMCWEGSGLLALASKGVAA